MPAKIFYKEMLVMRSMLTLISSAMFIVAPVCLFGQKTEEKEPLEKQPVDLKEVLEKENWSIEVQFDSHDRGGVASGGIAGPEAWPNDGRWAVWGTLKLKGQYDVEKFPTLPNCKLDLVIEARSLSSIKRASKKILMDGKYDWENRWIVDEAGASNEDSETASKESSREKREKTRQIRLRKEKLARFLKKTAHESAMLTVPIRLKKTKDGKINQTFSFSTTFPETEKLRPFHIYVLTMKKDPENPNSVVTTKAGVFKSAKLFRDTAEAKRYVEELQWARRTLSRIGSWVGYDPDSFFWSALFPE